MAAQVSEQEARQVAEAARETEWTQPSFGKGLFLGESGGNRNGMRNAAARLNELWQDAAKAYWIDDYYTKSHTDQNRYASDKLGVPVNQLGNHANILDTSEMLFVDAKHVRKSKMAPGGGYQNSGVSGDPSHASAEFGRAFLQIKIDNALAQIKGLLAGTIQPAAAPAARGGGAGDGGGRGGGRGGRGGAGRGGDPAAAGGAGQPAATPAAQAERPPTAETAPAGTPSQAPDTVFIDELTWEETRDAIKAGKTTVIVPTGGTEKNGYHMVLGKHNYIVTFAANQMARTLKNALVAPTIQYVPEGNPDARHTLCLPQPAIDAHSREHDASAAAGDEDYLGECK